MTAGCVMTFSEALSDARQFRGMSQRKISIAAGLSAGLISRYESGQRQPTRPAIAAMVEAMGLTGSEWEDDLYRAAGFQPPGWVLQRKWVNERGGDATEDG